MRFFRTKTSARQAKKRRSYASRPRAFQNFRGLRFEPLEERRLLSVVVNSINDVLYAQGSGLVSLRNAIAIADSSATPTTITFDPTVFAAAQTIVLTGGQLELSNSSESTTIIGPAAGVTISGNNASRVFQVDANVTASISGVAIANGNCSYWGGGILNSGALTLTNDTISNNFASYVGGGIYNAEVGSAYLTLTDVTIANNSSASWGGGLFNDQHAVLTNVTVVGNSAPGGGGISGNSHPEITTVLNNVTVSGNIASQGGGIYNNGSAGQFTLSNTIVAGNDASQTGSTSPDAAGPFASLGHNLIGKTDSSSGWVATDLTGTVASPLNAELGPLANNGGSTQTLLPLTGSPAIDNGSNALIPAGITTDQRGLPRICNGTVDIGAVEVQSVNVTNAVTGENTQTTSGLVVTPGGVNASSVTNFQITAITGGSLFLNDGITPIANGEFITLAQGAAGLKFTPTTGSLANGSFTVQGSTTADSSGLLADTATATITVLAPTPNVTNAATPENTQTTSGLVITPGAVDASLVTNYQITAITGGTLFLNDGVTSITNGEFITIAQGAAGLKFTPTTGSLSNGSFAVQDSTVANVSGLLGVTTPATITLLTPVYWDGDGDGSSWGNPANWTGGVLPGTSNDAIIGSCVRLKVDHLRRERDHPLA